MNELPRCRLCLVPYGVRHPRTCPLWEVLLSEADWRRLHGPQPEMTGARLGDVLVRAGVIDAAAVEDPDGYDGGQTVDALAMAARELAMPLHNAAAFCHEHGRIGYCDAIRAALAALGGGVT